jgi:hypothetical protein
VVWTAGLRRMLAVPADQRPGMGGSRVIPQLWPQIAARGPHFAKWQARTGRKLRVIVLTVHSPPG